MKAYAGLGFALAAYSMWGFFPIYWKHLLHVPPDQILAHRMVWSLVFVGTLLIAKRSFTWLKSLSRKVVLTYLTAAILLAANWFMYIWAVNNNHVVETALGYFINPLVNVLFGAWLLGEKPRPLQWAAIAAATLGVLYLSIVLGKPPFIALFLAATFGTYGLIKKRAALGALEGLTLETGLLFIPASLYLAFAHTGPNAAFGTHNTQTDILLMFSGVATALPLLFFAAAARRLTLTSLGIVQYLAPSIQFLLGVFLYKEPFGTDRLIGFSLIWTGVLLYGAELMRHIWRSRHPTPSQVVA